MSTAKGGEGLWGAESVSRAQVSVWSMTCWSSNLRCGKKKDPLATAHSSTESLLTPRSQRPLELPILCSIKLCLEMAVGSREVKDEDVCRTRGKPAAARIYVSAWLTISLSTNLKYLCASVLSLWNMFALWSGAMLKWFSQAGDNTYSCWSQSGSCEWPTVMPSLPYPGHDGALCL